MYNGMARLAFALSLRILETMSMKKRLVLILWMMVISGLAPASLQAESGAKPKWLAVGVIPGSARDGTEQPGTLEEGTPRNQLGGFSAIEYAGEPGRWFVLSDRGPADGAAAFECRFHEFELTVQPEHHAIQAKLQKTHLLRHSKGRSFVGASAAQEERIDGRSLALDSEGIRLAQDGTLWVSDEYGPRMENFTSEGNWIRSLIPPKSLHLTTEKNLAVAKQGAVPNRGLEGLALTPNGRWLIACMQGPTVQDSYFDEPTGYRLGSFVRLLRYSADNLETPPEQFVYPLEDISCGLSEILAVDDHRFLVLERDSLVGEQAKFKRIYLIDIRSANNVANLDSLNPRSLPNPIQPVQKELLIDLLDPAYGYSGPNALEKPEGLAFGPATESGKRILMVCFDNDFVAEVSNVFMAFEVAF